MADHYPPLTRIDERVATDARLSYAAKGLYLAIRALIETDGRALLSVEKLATLSANSETATLSRAKELERAGYLERRRMHTERGHVASEWRLAQPSDDETKGSLGRAAS